MKAPSTKTAEFAYGNCSLTPQPSPRHRHIARRSLWERRTDRSPTARDLTQRITPTVNDAHSLICACLGSLVWTDRSVAHERIQERNRTRQSMIVVNVDSFLLHTSELEREMWNLLKQPMEAVASNQDRLTRQKPDIRFQCSRKRRPRADDHCAHKDQPLRRINPRRPSR